MLLSATSVLALSSITYAAIGPSADIHVVNKVIQPDGFKRSAVLAGDSVNSAIFPGPVITGVKGDRFLLNVIDSLTDSSMLKSTSIHWHGLFQHGSSWADGTAFVTQCPIAPQHSFLYDFSVPDQAGTFWYHSHVSTQYCDGLRGAIVIYDPEDPYRSLYDVDDESTVITLADWYHTPAPSAGPAPLANSTLINGLGRYANGPSSPLAVIAVTSGKRYRFRLVSLSCDPDFIFSIDGHALTIIEVDGVNVEPLVVDSIDIFAGQRYSFILNADHTADNYWIRALPAGTTAFSGGLNSAILRYVGVQTTNPTTTSNLTNPMLETNLHPLQNPGAPGQAIQGGADVMLNLNIGYNASSVSYSINGAEFVPPTVPVLLQILSGARSAHELLPAGAVYSLPLNKVIEISIPGGAQDSPHPFHLHGHTFDVVRSAGSSDYNYENPVRRDVVSTGVAGDNVTIRFTTDNPGPWFLHCHIDWHLELGLAIVLAEAPSNIISQSHPAAWDSLCPTYKALSASNH